MKITIENFGPIHKFELDLSKNISLIYGKNNIGKSYAISVVYMLLKSFPKMTKKSDLESAIRKYTSNIRALRTENLPGPKKPDSEELHSRVNAIIVELLNDWIPEKLKLYLKSSYGDLKNVKNMLSEGFGQIYLEENSLSFRFILWENLDAGGRIGEVKTARKYFIDKELTVENIESICNTILKDFFRSIRLFTTSFYYIPAVRSGIYLALSNLGSIIAKINQYQGVIGAQSFILPNTTVPISDFYITISDKLAFADEDGLNYKSVVDKIEKNILGGSVQIDKDSGRILYFSHKLQHKFDLSQVSSMVSDLSIISVYLKFIIKDFVTGDDFDGEANLTVGVYPTLLIEEPEAHLHPEAQLKLMEYFVELSKLGIKIIMTTHSDYMFNKMGNQILARKIKVEDTGSYLLEMKEQGSVCSKRKMQPKANGIVDGNFYKATEKLYTERIKQNDKYYERLDRKNPKP